LWAWTTKRLVVVYWFVALMIFSKSFIEDDKRFLIWFFSPEVLLKTGANLSHNDEILEFVLESS